jgi:hypothetical protein
MSTLYFCHVPNPVIPAGRYYEDNDDGFVQEVRVTQGPHGRIELHEWRGVAYPLSAVRRYLLKFYKRNIDENAFEAQQLVIH